MEHSIGYLLYNTQRELIQQISVEHTRKLLGGRIGIVLYDVTTLYFETAREDALRSPGFSKDGKTAESQIVLGLLVNRDGYPLSYNVFNGAQYEGRTMIPSNRRLCAAFFAYRLHNRGRCRTAVKKEHLSAQTGRV